MGCLRQIVNFAPEWLAWYCCFWHQLGRKTQSLLGLFLYCDDRFTSVFSMVGTICLFILLLQEAVCPSCPKMIEYNRDLSITLIERPQPFFFYFVPLEITCSLDLGNPGSQPYVRA